MNKQTAENVIAGLETQGFTGYAEHEGIRYSVRIGCDSCSPAVINGVAAHEAGCRRQTYACKGCDARVSRRGQYCQECA